MSLRLLNVTHRYGDQKALDAVSLHVRRGDCYGFLGHNGAGKTTALRIALGLLRPHAGSVVVDGFDAAAHPVEARARMGGLIEAPGFHAGLSGLRNLVLLAGAQGMGRRESIAEASRVLTEVGLLHAAAKPAGAYSQGMRQRLGIAQAILGRPQIVLLDEPTNGLDPEGIEDIRRLLVRLTRDEGTTVLLSSHQLHEVTETCNRVAILREGRLLVEDETTNLLSGARYLLRSADPGAAERVLASLDLPHEPHADGMLVAVADADAPDVLGHLVAEGARPLSFAPRPVALEDVYLRYARESGDGCRDAAAAHDVATEAPSERLAPRRGLRRVIGYELRRWTSSATVSALLALPALAATAAIALRKVESGGFASAVAEGDVVSTTDVTAFEAVAQGLQAGLPVLALVGAALASQSLAGELSRGTLRNVVLRPLRRSHVAIGKSIAALVATAVGVGVLVAVTLGTAAAAFDFTDVSEILFNGERFPLVAASELYAPLREAIYRPLPALAATVGLGFLAGALTRRPAAALGTALGLLVVPDVLRSVLRGFDLEWSVPTAHMPTALGDSSYVAHFLDLTRGVSNSTPPDAAAAMWVPAVWLVCAIAVSTVVLSRRSIR